jgi:hypothetical protein
MKAVSFLFSANSLLMPPILLQSLGFHLWLLLLHTKKVLTIAPFYCLEFSGYIPAFHDWQA